ncbi:hypothetical protein OEA41_008176 [Lepraria neglecta]|uniref:Uncharacterized protein n=1 Tax=Lepraria neglecta TaxID=209136 RepID=A0AAD9ZE10_9LECA|nr:hypothetical protein OEA41_008176 [Lepraria neglecta]
MARRQLYRGTFWNQQYPLRYLPRYLRVQEWRLSSSWGRPGPDPKTRPEEKYEDWFSRWQRRKEEQYSDFAKRLEYKEKKYSDFMKKVEDDPYGVLFGRYWMKFADGIQSRDTRDSGSSASPDYGESLSPRAEKTITNNKPLGQINAGDKQAKPETVIVESREQEYEIDPITMRKVPKRAAPPVPPAVPKFEPPIFSFDIPIKRFRAPSTEPPSNQQSSKDPTKRNSPSESSPVAPSKPQYTKSWLAQEGFGRRQTVKVESQPELKTEDVKSKATAIKIENALDRHLKGRSTAEKDSERPALRYQPQENTTEDVDLLRSSDVRASAGLRGKAAKETDSEKQARQRKLEEEYYRRPLDRENQLAQEVATDTPKGAGGDKADTFVSSLWMNEISDREPIVSSTRKAADQQTHDGSDAVSAAHKPVAIAKPGSAAQEAMIAKANKIKAQIVPVKVRLDVMKAEYEALRQRWLDENRRQKAAKRANEIHEEEVKAQKLAMQAMETRGAHKRDTAKAPDINGDKKSGPRPLQSFLPGEGDLAMNVVEFAERDRWYKQKAPHAMEENDAKLKKLAKDRELLREVRSIYEDAYGIIDTKHRQPSQLEDGSKPLTASKDKAPGTAGTSVQSSSGFSSSDSKGEEPSSSTFTQEAQSQSLDNAQSSDSLAIIQRLLNELRQAQDLIHKHCTALQLNEETDSFCTVADMMPGVSKSYEQTVLQIAKSALKLTNTAMANSANPTTSRAPSSSAIKFTNAEMQTSTTPNVYRILAYDSVTQKVISSPKTTSLAPFSKEQPLMPVEALEVLNNPGKFLPHLMTLHNKGYNVVSGTSNILVFKKEATGDELAAAKHAEAMKHPNPVDGTIASTGNFASPTGFVNHDSPIPLEELEQHRAASEAGSSEAAPEASVNEPSSSNKVRREEAVFSGGRRGGWQETHGRRFKNKKQRRRKRTFGRMLLTGTLTAASCYAVGVASEMMRH